MLPTLVADDVVESGYTNDLSDFGKSIQILSNEGYKDKTIIRTILGMIPLLKYADEEEDHNVSLPNAHNIEDSVICLIAILKLHSSDSDIYRRTLNATQWIVSHFRVGQSICVALVSSLQVRKVLTNEFVADEEYRKGFYSLKPAKIKGCEGVWRHVFDYHYPTRDKAASLVYLCLSVIRDLTRSNTVQNRNSLIDAGACEVITSLFATHAAIPDIAHECCKAVIVLAHAGRQRLIASGACAGVVEALNIHREVTSNALNGCRAIHSLSLDAEGRDRLVAADACHTLVGVISLHLKDSSIVREGCLAVYRLSLSSRENKMSFFHAGFCEVLMLVHRTHGQSNEINVRGMIRDFVHENEVMKCRFVLLGAHEIIPGLII